VLSPRSSFHTYPLADVGERPAEQDEEVEGLVHEALPALLQDPLKGLAMEPLIGVIPLLDGQQVVQGQALRGEGRLEDGEGMRVRWRGKETGLGGEIVYETHVSGMENIYVYYI
jgi:hypothetical protein